MSMNKASKVKFVLGIIAMTSFAAITPATANVTTLEPSSSFQNIMSQAKLSFDSPTQQLKRHNTSSSLKKLNPSSELGLVRDGGKCKNNGACNC